ncbi:MAG: restriction endonuclease subunit S [Rhodocyclaceae bacterium]|nr:restriction endonuclease subunit S [Rhodocyclaceae bacterium]
MHCWPHSQLDELCEVTSSKRIYAKELCATGVPFYRSKEIIEKLNGQETHSNPLFISEERYQEILRLSGVPIEGDLLLTSRGTLGIPYIVTKSDRFHFADGNLTWFRRFRGLDSTYLNFFLVSPLGKAELARCVIGSSQLAYTIAALKKIAIPLPPIAVQQRIASILSSYDDLIENNQRRIRILEDMARSLYREWFVHFRYPGHESVPLIVSPFGPIPKGWETIPFQTLLASMTGGDWGSDQPTEKESAEVSIVRGTDFKEIAYGGEIRAPVRFIKPTSLKSRGIRLGDVIVENSINAKSRCIGTTLLVDNKALARIGREAVAASFCKVFRLHDPRLSPLVHLHFRRLREDAQMEYYQNVAANGIGNFQAQKFAKEEHLILPTDELLRSKLIERITVMFKNIGVLSSQLSNLRRTRDLLLPRLLSGQVALSTDTPPTTA